MSRKITALFLATFLLAPLTIAFAGALFWPANNYPSGGGAGSIAVADVNGDGKLDLVVANSGVAVLLGNADGTFQAPVSYSSGGNEALSVAVADVNGDGKPDIVVTTNICPLSACPENGIIGVLLGNGDGTFQAAVTYDSGGVRFVGQSNSVAISDVNHDGKPDVLVANNCSTVTDCTGNIGVLLGNGDGTFQPVKTYSSGNRVAVSIALADVNSDGNPDILVANECFECLNGYVGVLLGNSDGTFQTALTYNSGGYQPLSLGVADVNGDGKLDVVVMNPCSTGISCHYLPGNVGVLVGNGDGTFQDARTYSTGGEFGVGIAIADVNGDAKPDLLVASQCFSSTNCVNGWVSVFLGNGDSTFQKVQKYNSGGVSPNAIAAADVNGDGRPDLLVTNRCTGNGPGCFAPIIPSVGVLLRRVYSSTTKITTSSSPSIPHQPVTFTASVTSAFGSIPDGETVSFHIGTTQIGTATTTSGAAKLTTSALSAGSDTITATYPGDFNFQSSSGVVHQVEIYPSITSLSSTPNPSTFGEKIRITAVVSSEAPGGPTGSVTFKNGSTVLNTVQLNSGTATWVTGKLPIGTLALTATYQGDAQSARSTSPPLSEVVNCLCAKTINVPANQATIQAGINAANNGDTVLVAPGTYKENINFHGKAITVKSSVGNAHTFIDGGKVASVVTFSSGETLNSVLTGFTLQNGNSPQGGGIFVTGASPTIRENRILNNDATDEGGGGIAVVLASPLIQNNIIANNFGLEGGGISIRGASSAQIIGNVIHNNVASYGGGIALDAAGAPLIENNQIFEDAGDFQGGGVYIVNEADAALIQNLIYANDSPAGGGVYFSVPMSATGLLFVNNTFDSNSSTSGVQVGSGIWAGGFDSNDRFFNNLVIGYYKDIAFHCDTTDSPIPPKIEFTDAWSSGGIGFDGSCVNETGMNGNISADPMFGEVNVGQYNFFELLGGSPAIDSGSNFAPRLPSKDFGGQPRIVNGNHGTTAVVDMGAYEFLPVVLSPNLWQFGLHPVGSVSSVSVRLINEQNTTLNISSFSVPTGYSVSGCGATLAASSVCYLNVTFNPLTAGAFSGTLVVKDDASNSPQVVTLSGRAQ